MFDKWKRGLVALSLAVLCVGLSGCGIVGVSPPEPSSGGERVSSEAKLGALESPGFTGPFADQYEEAWLKSKTDAVRTILSDELITDQEWSQVRNELFTCAKDHGITISNYVDGAYEAKTGDMDGELANRTLGECEVSSGEAWIGWLYRSQTSNPTNIPETQLLTDCLVRNGAVPPSYTEKQYFEDVWDFSFPWVDEGGYDTFERCSEDWGYTR